MDRIGHSFDIHPLAHERPLWLGGLLLREHDGLFGHSDGDVVLHVIAEAILGALGLGDLGEIFPDDDPKTEGIQSTLIVKKAVSMMEEKGYEVINLDVMVALREPSLRPYKERMRISIASLLHTPVEQVSIKAMSGNGIGPIGQKEAIAASAVILLNKGE